MALSVLIWKLKKISPFLTIVFFANPRALREICLPVLYIFKDLLVRRQNELWPVFDQPIEYNLFNFL